MNNNPNGESILTLPLLVARSLVVFPSMSEDIEVGREFSLKAVSRPARPPTTFFSWSARKASPPIPRP